MKKNILLLTTLFLATQLIPKLHPSTAINTSIQKQDPEVTQSRRDVKVAKESKRLARRKKRKNAQTQTKNFIISIIVRLGIEVVYSLWKRSPSGGEVGNGIKPAHIWFKQGQNQIDIKKDKIWNDDSLSKTTPAEKSQCPICYEKWLCDLTTYEKEDNLITQTTRIRICKCRDSFNICLNCWDNWLEGKEECPLCRSIIQKSELNKARKLLEVVKIIQKVLKKEKLSLQEEYNLLPIKKSEIITWLQPKEKSEGGNGHHQH